MRRGSLRRWVVSDRGVATLLGTFSAVIVGLMVLEPVDVPFTAAFLPMVLAVLLLSNRALTWFAVYMLFVLTAAVMVQDAFPQRNVIAVCVMYLVTFAVIAIAQSRRDRLAVSRGRGESMLVDLRDRILAQGVIPELPDCWMVESAMSSAGGSPFAGDFVVASSREDGSRVDLVVVDVSGKGEAAGTRALQLSGAMGGLVGTLPASAFLPAANDYLLQRSWEEGFATAAHLSLDLASGDFELRCAGHPPGVQRVAGSGKWLLLRTEGPVLGVVEDVHFEGYAGRLAPGDSLLLYTDGMVEEPRRDIELGIDHMLGTAEGLLRHGWVGLADRLVGAVGSKDDDRALVVVHRRS